MLRYNHAVFDATLQIFSNYNLAAILSSHVPGTTGSIE